MKYVPFPFLDVFDLTFSYGNRVGAKFIQKWMIIAHFSI